MAEPTEQPDSPLPRVTVLTSVYNGERYVREALDSILAQSFRDFELLIIDDGSTDATPQILDSYSDPRLVRVRNPENLGLTRSLNLGLRLARGEYVARQDADDVSEPDRLAQQVEYMAHHPDVPALGSWFTRIDAEGRSLGVRCPPADPTEIRWRLLFHNPLAHSSMMLRMEILAALGFYDESFSYAMDYELWARLARRMPITNLEAPLVRFRINPSSMSETYGSVADAEVLAIPLAYVREVVSSAEGQVDAFDEPFITGAQALLYRPHLVVFGAAEGRRIVERIWWLSDAFCRYYDLRGRARRRERTQLRSRLVRHLLRLAYRALRTGERRTAVQFSAEASRIAIGPFSQSRRLR